MFKILQIAWFIHPTVKNRTQILAQQLELFSARSVIGVEEERTAPKPAADPPTSMPQRHKTDKFITCQMPWKKRYIFAFFFSCTVLTMSITY